jgi:glycosyltransferase involved in cell wall biosynthesis
MNCWSRISVVMITLNAEALLSESLRSIPAGAEIIIADADSSDQTVAIARSFGAQVIKQDQEKIAESRGNFDIARNQAMEKACRDWLFILDSDEIVSPELAREIGAAIFNDGKPEAYAMPRRNLFWGKPVRLLGEDRQIRLLRKGSGRYAGCSLHCSLNVDGSVGQLKEPLIHHNITGWPDVSRRFRRYLPVERLSRESTGGRLAALRTAMRMGRYYLIGQQAWRDGWRGIVTSCIYSLYHGLAQWPGAK